MTLLEVNPEHARQAAKLVEIRAELDSLATQHCNACMGKGPAPDFSVVPGLLKEVTAMHEQLPELERAKADMMLGCGWHMLHEDEKALDPLLRVMYSNGGVEVADQLSAILVVMQILRKKGSWDTIVQAGSKAFEVDGGQWADPVLPFLKGVALARLNKPAEAADFLEEAINMNAGFKQAYLEFDQAATTLRDFERCRRVAQKLVQHGGHWVSCWQRPLHFHAGEDPKVTSQPWYDPDKFELVRCLEDNVAVIQGELAALCARPSYRWGGVGTAHRGNQNSSHDADLVAAGEWQEVVLLGDSDECIDNCSHCPAQEAQHKASLSAVGAMYLNDVTTAVDGMDGNVFAGVPWLKRRIVSSNEMLGCMQLLAVQSTFKQWSSLSVQPPGKGEQTLSEESILSKTQVYVLCIPSRLKHAQKLMKRWGFNAVFVPGPDKREPPGCMGQSLGGVAVSLQSGSHQLRMDLDDLVASGVITEGYLDVIWQDVEYMPEGKVACHLGHLNILQRFLASESLGRVQADAVRKAYALIFEDDLEPGQPALAAELRDFLSRVPTDFDLLHLGFVRESLEARKAVDSGGQVFRSVEALGRHAYLVNKRVAELLVEHTLPMYNHGDKMFQQVYQKHNLKAYHPKEPLFYQDRINFESELTERWKPSRAFQPTSDNDFIRDCDRPEMLRRHERKMQEQTEIMAMQSKVSSVLFLNIDGVLNRQKTPSSSSRCGRALPGPLRILARVLQRAPSCVVLTSPWRLDERYAGRFSSALAREGVPWAQAVLAVTPDGRGRGFEGAELKLLEIRSWLESNTWVEEWAILDCLDLTGLDESLHGRVVCTDCRSGLQEEEAELLVNILTGT
ncbi:unnamed protein product [Symbiodinium pilosum]|uniref:Uncharacterized protein n=1 Tax=Symbiodinium pilosum TaxID=2952 RepID=A0A812IPG3_SYMPI|nr:unnamed protein product [Symbiodinium pilosum]